MLAVALSLVSGVSATYSNAWAGVRGVNYVPSYSRNPIQTWADYDKATVERELGYAQSLHLNVVRIFLHLFAYYAEPDKFLANYDHLVAACASRGIRPLVVLFDDDFYVRTPRAPGACHLLSGRHA